MGQCFQPEMGQVTAGQAAEPSDAEILAAVRRVLTDEEVEHPGIGRASAGRSWFAGRLPGADRPVKPSLAARLLGRLRG